MTTLGTAVDREAIFVALFTKLQTIPGVVTFSRIFTGFDDIPAGSQPAMFLLKGDEHPTFRRGMPTQWRLDARIILAARVLEADPSVAPSTTLNVLLQAVEQTLYRDPLEGPASGAPFQDNPDMMLGTTLGGLCQSCAIDGDIVTDEGAQGEQGGAMIPITIHVTATA